MYTLANMHLHCRTCHHPNVALDPKSNSYIRPLPYVYSCSQSTQLLRCMCSICTENVDAFKMDFGVYHPANNEIISYVQGKYLTISRSIELKHTYGIIAGLSTPQTPVISSPQSLVYDSVEHFTV